MKKYSVILLLLLLTIQWDTKAISPAWGYNNNRIAISSDGNSAPDYQYKWPTGDPDDWGANAAILTVIAKMKLQNKLVHYSYNNFIDAPSGPDSLNRNKQVIEEGIRLFNYNKSKFFDVTTNLDLARSNLAKEMAKSCSGNPLYFIHAGLSEFVYQAVNEVIKMGKIESLKYVKLISHSGFNEDEIRRPTHHSWKQIQELSGNRIQYLKIQDQNDCQNINHLWCSGKDYSPWYWIRDSQDNHISWMYKHMLTAEVADISDCGMVYYLFTGDENGSPSKFKAFLESNVSN